MGDRVQGFTSIIETFKREFKDVVIFKDKVLVQLKDFEALLQEYSSTTEAKINKMRQSVESDLQTINFLSEEIKQSNN